MIFFRALVEGDQVLPSAHLGRWSLSESEHLHAQIRPLHEEGRSGDALAVPAKCQYRC